MYLLAILFSETSRFGILKSCLQWPVTKLIRFYGFSKCRLSTVKIRHVKPLRLALGGSGAGERTEHNQA